MTTPGMQKIRDHEGGRVSGPCAGGNHHYCLGDRGILPCTCHEHTDPEQR